MSKIRNILKEIITVILETIYYRDSKCICCNNEIYNHDYLCGKCRKKMNLYAETFFIKDKYNIKCYTCDVYSSVMRNLILKLKYSKKFFVAEFFSKMICNRIKDENLNIDLVTFVPSSRKREKKRGYNQAEVIAKYSAKEVNKKCIGLLRKDGETKDQIGLDFHSRRCNVKKAFRVKKCFGLYKDYIVGKKILIIDDVITTGATGYNCAEALLDYGAKEVFIMALAKAN